jgi:NAD(P)H-hydrate epimerase
MRALSVAQVREADRRCIDELGIPGAVLMDNAGEAVFRELRPGAVGVVCGKGNNGGDGFVIARRALAEGRPASVVLLAELDEVHGDAALFMNAYRRLGGEMVIARNAPALAAAYASLGFCETLVDAILGTGIRGEVRGLMKDAIESWPRGYTVAVDVPSGLDADTGEPCGCCLRAEVTVTFQFMKRGFQNPSARPYLGRLIVADIGIPPICADDDGWRNLRNP